MAVLCRWTLLLTLLLAGGPRLWAASAADRAFDAAVKAFQDKFYARAEAQLADYCQKFPASPRLAEVILVQAQARLELTNYAGAIELLTANQGKAGTNADQYLFWLAEASYRKGDYRTASDDFAKLVRDFPASPRCLEAALDQAFAQAALARTEPAEWHRVIGLLQQTNGVFQSAARTNASSDLVPRGYFLLSEAQLATKDYHAAEETLQPLAKSRLSPRLAWHLQYLLCRIQLADGRTNAALAGTTNLLVVAANASETNLLAESAALRADLLERLGQTNEALVAYQRNLAAGIPADRQRQALLKIAELSPADNIPQATQMLEQFPGLYTNAASADLALLTLGELRLRQYEAEAGTNQPVPAITNAPAGTNVLQLAVASLDMLVKQFPQSPLFGKAQLDLGWCYGRQRHLPEAQAAYQRAVECLPPASLDQATAYFRLADVQFQETNFDGAIKSCQAIIDKFGGLPEVITNLFEPVLYETVRAGLSAGKLATATNALQNLLALYPHSLSAARAVLLTGQDLGLRGDPAAARKLLLDFDKAAPDAPLRAERQLAVAATLEQENKWTEAIAQYDGWLASFPKNEAVPRAEYYRAWDTWQAGRDTNALALFTNIVAQFFPTNEYARLAQMWVAYYSYRMGDPVAAERNYQVLFQNTNWPPDELSYQAQLMAGRAAVARQGWIDARTYFTQLYNNTNGPSLDLRYQALFEHALALMRVVDPADTNRLANMEQATIALGRICDDYSTNKLAVRAWGERANCYLQWALARQQYDSLTNAINAYQHVLDSRQADVALRSEAKVGLAVTLSKWAEQKTGKERTALLEQALNHCLDVVYGRILRDDERLDPFWTKEAGVRAVELADSLQAWSQEVRLYERLTNTVWPQFPAWLEKGVKKARENLEQEKTAR
jgi:TolA-binding protein